MSEWHTDLNKSITIIDGCLIVALAGEMSDENLRNISELVTQKTYEADIVGVIFNFARIGAMDSYVFNSFTQMSQALCLLGVSVVWAGLSPAVICGLIDLNLSLDKTRINTVLNLDQGIAYLKEAKTHKDDGR